MHPQAQSALCAMVVELAAQRAAVDVRLRPSALVLSLRALADAIRKLRAAPQPSGSATWSTARLPLLLRIHSAHIFHSGSSASARTGVASGPPTVVILAYLQPSMCAAPHTN